MQPDFMIKVFSPDSNTWENVLPMMDYKLAVMALTALNLQLVANYGLFDMNGTFLR